MFAAGKMMMARSGVDADFDAYLAAGIANGSTMSAGNQTAVYAFIVGCKADGVWTPIKASCILAAWDSLAGALTPLVGPAPTNVNFASGDYSKTTGLLGNGTTKYLNSNYADNADPQNDCHLTIELHTATALTNRILLGVYHLIAPAYGVEIISAGGSFRNRSSGSAGPGSAVSGYLGSARSGATATTRRYSGTTYTGTDASVAPVGLNHFVFARNQDGTVTLHTAVRARFYSLGRNITHSLLDARLATLMTALT